MQFKLIENIISNTKFSSSVEFIAQAENENQAQQEQQQQQKQ